MELTILYFQWHGNLKTGFIIFILPSRLLDLRRAFYYLSISVTLVVHLEITAWTHWLSFLKLLCFFFFTKKKTVF